MPNVAIGSIHKHQRKLFNGSYNFVQVLDSPSHKFQLEIEGNDHNSYNISNTSQQNILFSFHKVTSSVV